MNHSQNYEVLVINLGSTSSKVAVYKGEELLFGKNISHPNAEYLSRLDPEASLKYRKSAIDELIKAHNYEPKHLSAVVARGGLLHPVPSGTFLVNEDMLIDLRAARYGEHPSNLSALVGDLFAKNLGIPCYVVDPVVVDELSELAKVSGSPLITRISIFHALNQKAVARAHAAKVGKSYEESSLIVVHMGGGITVGTHARGKVIEVNNGFMGEGPMSPNRPGGLPVLSVVKICERLEKEDFADLRKRLTQSSGLLGYFGTSDVQELRVRQKNGEEGIELILSAMAYQIAKEIGASASVLFGKVDAILLTGGLANDEALVEEIKDRVSFIANVFVYPGENEMMSLAQGCLRVLSGNEEVKLYERESSCASEQKPK